MDDPVGGLFFALLACCGGLLLFRSGYLLGKDAGIRQERANWVAMFLVWWVAVREKRRG